VVMNIVRLAGLVTIVLIAGLLLVLRKRGASIRGSSPTVGEGLG